VHQLLDLVGAEERGEHTVGVARDHAERPAAADGVRDERAGAGEVIVLVLVVLEGLGDEGGCDVRIQGTTSGETAARA
jgi:hypothetical protein